MDENHQQLLKNCGSWMQALACGEIVPYTEGQRRFVRVALGELAPSNPFEIAWHAFRLHQDSERKRLINLAESGALSYDQVRTLYDNRIHIGFSDEQTRTLQRRLQDLVTPRAPTIEHWIHDDIWDLEFQKACEAIFADDVPEL